MGFGIYQGRVEKVESGKKKKKWEVAKLASLCCPSLKCKEHLFTFFGSNLTNFEFMSEEKKNFILQLTLYIVFCHVCD